MESLKRFQEELAPLKNLKSRVDHFASLCCPDFTYTEEDERGLIFASEEELDVGYYDGVIGLRIKDREDTPLHLFTKWSWSQLRSHLGVRQKWFDVVSLEQAATELNKRRHTLRGFVFRTMKTVEEDLRVVRGMVSPSYTDIPDTDIMSVLTGLFPNGQVVHFFSGKTDRAFYAHVILGNNPCHIPGTRTSLFPGVTIKNSEVGYSSLYVVPMLYMAERKAIVSFDQVKHLRRTHRGQVSAMRATFDQAINEVKDYWSDLNNILVKLEKVTYSDEEAAAETAYKLVRGVGGTKAFAHACRLTYKRLSFTTHTAASVFEAIAAEVAVTQNKDDAYTRASIAGAVMLKLWT
jgi:hypothetical protein